MKAYLVLAILFKMHECSADVAFTISKVSDCHNHLEDDFIISESGSLQKCVYECAIRPWCEASAYMRRVHVCALAADASFLDATENGQEHRVMSGCIYVRKESITFEHLLDCQQTCPLSVCEINDTQILCRRDCLSLTVLHGTVQGNGNTEGSGRTVSCAAGYLLSGTPGPITCQNGTWLPEVTCIAQTTTTQTPTTSTTQLMTTSTDKPAVQVIAQWVDSVAKYSSEWKSNDGWHADEVIGPPDVYPKYGDLPGAWAPSSDNNQEYLVLLFAKTVNITGIDIYETHCGGSITQVKCYENGIYKVLWTTPGVESLKVSRIFQPFLASGCYSNRIKILIAAVRNWVNIDAVRLYGYE